MTGSVFVPGTPAPQGSMRAFVVAGRARVTADNQRTTPWRAEIASAVRNVVGNTIPYPDGPVALTLQFIMPRRASEPKRVTPAHVRKPDIDKLQRACLYALTGVLVRDDSQVVEIHAHKRTADIAEMPGLVIEWETP